jgi:ketosteroid isomerase-like protein
MKCRLLGASLAFLAGALVAARVNNKSDQEALLQADRDFAATTAARGLDGFGSFLAENAGTLRPDQPVITGKAALLADWKPLLTNPMLAIHWQPISASASKQGDLGYTVGSYEITKTDVAGKHTTATGKYVTVWRKQRDRAWKVEFDSGVSDTPPDAKK